MMWIVDSLSRKCDVVTLTFTDYNSPAPQVLTLKNIPKLKYNEDRQKKKKKVNKTEQAKNHHKQQESMLDIQVL